MSFKPLFSILLAGVTLMATEEPKYKVVEKVGRIEIRQYEPYMVAQTKVNASFDQAGNQAFRILFQYISGANKTQTSIAMTAPVAQTKDSDGSWTVSFMVPSEFTPETVPQPTDSRVSIVAIPGSLVAAINTSGFWSENKVKESEVELDRFIQSSAYTRQGPFTYGRYNAPFVPFFMRRNELMCTVVRK
jgi:hypothetical protein